MTTVIDMKQTSNNSCTKVINSQKLFLKNNLSNNNNMVLNIEEENVNLNIISQLKLRFLDGDDIEALKQLCIEWFPIKYPDSWYKLVAFDERFYSLAATYKGKIVAVLIAEIKPRWQVSKEDGDLLATSFSQDTKIAYILSIGVHKPYRRQGLASFLLDNFLASTCAQENLVCQEVKAIYLHVLCSNHGAIKFYERHKFRLLHFLPSYYLIDGDAKDGYSYVLHINGGKPPVTCVDYFYNVFNLLRYLQLCYIPTKLIFGMNKLLRYFTTWPNLTPFISKNRQCHNL